MMNQSILLPDIYLWLRTPVSQDKPDAGIVRDMLWIFAELSSLSKKDFSITIILVRAYAIRYIVRGSQRTH